MVCANCGNILVAGKKRDIEAYWCPKCENVNLLNKEDALDFYNLDLAEKEQLINEFIKKYNKKSIVLELCKLFELSFLVPPINYLLCPTAYAIKDILNTDDSKFGISDINSGDNFQLAGIFNDVFITKFRDIPLLEDGYNVIIELTKDQIPNYFDDTLIASPQEEKIYQIKFTEEWEFTRLVFSRYGLQTPRDQIISENGPNKWTLRRNNEDDLNRDKYTFQFACCHSDLANNMHENVKLFESLHQILKDLEENNDLTMDETVFLKVKKEDIVKSISKVDNKSEEVYDKIKNIDFPIIVEIGDLCILLPNACSYYLYQLFIKKNEYELNDRSNLGKALEDMAYEILNRNGFDVFNPNTGKILKNFYVGDVDDLENGKQKKYEMDVAGFTENKSIIFECKYKDITNNFFMKKAIDGRKKILTDELNHFQNKIEMMKKNENFKFLTEGKEQEYIFLTSHPEPIESYGEIKVVPFNKLNIENVKKHLIDEKNSCPELEIEYQFGIDGNYVYIDYTQSIKNPFGIGYFGIDPENDFQQTIFVGDGYVLDINENGKEVTIESTNKRGFIIDLNDNDIEYLKSKNVKVGSRVRYQLYTTDPLYGVYNLRAIRVFE